jgi:hypothetical protein
MPFIGLRVVILGLPEWLPPLLSLMWPGPPRLDLPIVPLLIGVPVFLSVRRLLCVPMFPMPVFLHRVAAPLLVPLRDDLSTTLVLYLPSLCVALGLHSYAPLARILHVPHVVPFASRPGCGGASDGGRRAAHAVVSRREAAGAGRRSIVVVAAGRRRATASHLVRLVVVVLLLFVVLVYLHLLVGGGMLPRMLVGIGPPVMVVMLLLSMQLVVVMLVGVLVTGRCCYSRWTHGCCCGRSRYALAPAGAGSRRIIVVDASGLRARVGDVAAGGGATPPAGFAAGAADGVCLAAG